MSDFKGKLKMFETNKTLTPQIKTKPSKIQLPPQSTAVENNGVSNTIENELGSSFSDSNKVPILNKNELVSQNCYLIEDDIDDYTFSFLESVYDLPGFEHFIFDTPDIIVTNVPECVNPQTESEEKNIFVCDFAKVNQTEVEDKKDDTEIQLAPSPNLIEEIFNTSLWRNSADFSDDFIINQIPANDVPCETPDCSIQSPMHDRRKTQSSGRRSIFSSIFKSKKGSKKSIEKVPGKDNSDNDSLKESSDKNKQNNKHEEDNKSTLDHDTKKPLNSIFNRDWLNNIGDGIKKKATVMSELKKMFNHGKFKNFKKISNKNSYDINT